MLETSCQWVVWLSVLGLTYIFLGYPALTWALGRWFPRTWMVSPWTTPFSVVIVAHNEERTVGAKLAGLVQSTESPRIDEIIVASDGSTDATADVVRAFHEERVRLMEFSTRRGKAAVLNDVLATCRGEVVVLMDARQELHPEALRHLLANFADSRVGVVSGELVFRQAGDPSSTARGVGMYWAYEKFIRRNESRRGAVPGATGALYAIRRHLIHPISERTLLDDVAIPMGAVTRGFLCVFESGAVVYDHPSTRPSEEQHRKRRTIAGVAQLMALYPAWLLPWRNPIWLEYVSHKLARLLSPFLLASLLAANIALFSLTSNYLCLLYLQLGFYACAALAIVLQRMGYRVGWLALPLVFVLLNVTTALALWDAARRRCDPIWQRAYQA